MPLSAPLRSVVALLACLLVGVTGFHLSELVVSMTYGSIRGLTMKPKYADLDSVGIFLGIPYAAPPVGHLRFMPPMSPLSWSGIRRADKMPPVCPQKLPNIKNRRQALKNMPEGRYKYLTRLLPHLQEQNEDCLFLNVYTPLEALENKRQLPVIVFIHGESYEWNSGNPYDGSVLASYGKVVVVTVNFRLGILGFLRPTLKTSGIGNFGLVDQMAALQWVKDNIKGFGGDPNNVTLFGHGTGAALANLLLMSPVTQGKNSLFRRAILMSGSALSRWTMTWNPSKYTIQVAREMNCPLTDQNDELVQCLRSKSVEELLSVSLHMPAFSTPFGPIIDNITVEGDPSVTMDSATAAFGRYGLLYGVTRSECYNMFSSEDVKRGMSEERRNRLLRAYGSSNFDEADHGAIHGEELPYVFGAPLVDGISHFPKTYTREEVFLSELIMTQWTNFAKRGDPNLPTPQGYLSPGANLNWYENLKTLWPGYEKDHRKYLHLDNMVVVKSHYRSEKMRFWNSFVPQLERSHFPTEPTSPYPPPQVTLYPTVPPIFINGLLTTAPTSTPSRPKPKPTYFSKPGGKIKGEPFSPKWPEELPKSSEPTPSTSPPVYAGTPISIVILVGICIMFINCFAMAGVYYQRDKLRYEAQQGKNSTKSKKAEPSNEYNLGAPTPTSSAAAASDTATTGQKDRRRRSSSRKKSSATAPDRGVDSAKESISRVSSTSRVSSVSRDSSMKRKNVTQLENTNRNTVKNVKNAAKSSSKPTHKRNKSETPSIYSEISRGPNVIVHMDAEGHVSKRGALVKFNTMEGITPKSLMKSNTSIASKTSGKSITSRASVKSTASRTSIKSTLSEKPLKKNASCQSLPTAEYSWGITKEMTITRDDPEGSRGDEEHSRKNTAVANIQKMNYPKVLPDVPSNSSTLPKARPPPPPRSTSLTSKDIKEIEAKVQVVRRKKSISRRDASTDSCDLSGVEIIYNLEDKTHSSPTLGSVAPNFEPSSKVQNRKSDGATDYGRSKLKMEFGRPDVADGYCIYDKSPSPSEVTATVSTYSINTTPQRYVAYDSRTPRGPLATFGKGLAPIIYTSGTSTTGPVTTTYGATGDYGRTTGTGGVLYGSSGHLPSYSNAAGVTQCAHKVLSTATAPAFVESSPSSSRSCSRVTQGVGSSSSSTPSLVSPAVHEPKSSLTQLNNTHLYDASEGTGTIKRKKSLKSGASTQTGPLIEVEKGDKPLKSALKQISAYDKPKGNITSTGGGLGSEFDLLNTHGSTGIISKKGGRVTASNTKARAKGTSENSSPTSKHDPPLK
ncbi:uncharacterized protein LOC143033450 isoform X2 [Oratosquilla oratoria]|uniref:uncharacterized protein LOC143033450 isoform X2 n=1 Tax=Oratosquilla oratoria TaxID=337810 RepID=UPI003F7622A4